MNIAESTLRHSILATLSYFDGHNYPLTSFELYQSLLFNIDDNTKVDQVELDYKEFENFLNNDSFLQDKINNNRGFWNLNNDQAVVLREKGWLEAQIKYKRAIKVAKLLANVPFVRALMICNTLAYNCVQPSSDIDFFIIVKSGRIWLTRFMATVILEILRLRPKKGQAANAICLSFWITSDQLNIQEITLKPHDIYFYYWLNKLNPVYNKEKQYEDFVDANQWIKAYLPLGGLIQGHHKRQIKLKIGFKKFFETLLQSPLGDNLEKLAKKLQLKKMSEQVKAIADDDSDTRVIVNDTMLKFHGGEDRRQQYLQTFNEKYAKTQS